MGPIPSAGISFFPLLQINNYKLPDVDGSVKLLNDNRIAIVFGDGALKANFNLFRRLKERAEELRTSLPSDRGDCGRSTVCGKSIARAKSVQRRKSVKGREESPVRASENVGVGRSGQGAVPRMVPFPRNGMAGGATSSTNILRPQEATRTSAGVGTASSAAVAPAKSSSSNYVNAGASGPLFPRASGSSAGPRGSQQAADVAQPPVMRNNKNNIFNKARNSTEDKKNRRDGRDSCISWEIRDRAVAASRSSDQKEWELSIYFQWGYDDVEIDMFPSSCLHVVGGCVRPLGQWAHLA